MKRNVNPIVGSWVLDALRRVMGLEDIRNDILHKQLKSYKHICYGKTFGSETKKTTLMQYLEEIIVAKNDCQFLIMTATNMALRGETHYQVFIADYSNNKLWVIDPSSVKKKAGIYAPFIALETIMPFFKEKGWETDFVNLTNPCQTTEDDVFCQSWGLFLVLEVIPKLKKQQKDTSIQIQVPRSLMTRYKKLIGFYHKFLPLLCEDLKETYQQTIKSSRDLVKEAKNKKEKEEIVRYYLQFDPCKELQSMNAIDLMTEEQEEANI